MFPALLGPTRQATCPACQFTFPIAAETFRSELPTRCERCGGRCDVAAEIQPGQTAELEPLDLDWLTNQNSPQRIQRWDLIAFQVPGSRNTHVKRVWGLPGECVELREGEILIDGQPLRKSLAELRRLAVPVYELRPGDSGQWWLSSSKETSPSTSLILRPNQCARFQYCRPAPVHPSEAAAERWLEPSPLVDNYSINQGISTVFHPVDDCLLSLSLSQPLHGSLTIEMRRQKRVVRVVVVPLERSTDRPESRGIHPGEPGASDEESPVATWRIAANSRIDIAWCDGRLLLESDSQARTIESDELESALAATPPASPGPPWSQHELFRMTASGSLIVTSVRLSRDLFLATTIGGQQHGDSEPVLPDSASGYFVLGDNLAVSRDSRQQLGRVALPQVLGRITPVPAPH